MIAEVEPKLMIELDLLESRLIIDDFKKTGNSHIGKKLVSKLENFISDHEAWDILNE